MVDGVDWTAVAERQAGMITRRQLTAVGLRSSTVDDWLRTGRLVRLSTAGVYRVAGTADTPHRAAWFAALSSRAPVSYLTAGQWWELPVPDDGLVHITRLERRRLDWPTGVRVHRVAVRRADLIRHRGLWVTTRTVTLLDCLGWVSFVDARQLADRAISQKWLTVADIVDRLESQPGRWGNRQLRRLAGAIGVGAAESERRLHRLLRRAGITGWTPNLPVTIGTRSYEIDVAFPEARIAIEVDGFRYHSEGDRFQQDRTKQNALTAAGWRILRFTWADLAERPGYVIDQIRRLLLAQSA
jgi:very-short-patch-repair endonuclease